MAELPFVEKYRPESLEGIVGDSGTDALRAFVKTGQFPLAMILYGGYGTGKTARARALVRDYYVQNGLYLPSATFRDIRSGSRLSPEYQGIFPPVLYVDAAVTRDIEFIKNTVQTFMKTVSPKGLKKFVIFDEADRLSFDAQRSLRPLIEKYPNTVTIYTTNELDKIDPAIQDRAAGATFEVRYPGAEDVTRYLKELATKEQVEIPDEKLRQIAVESESVRQAVGRLGTEITVYRSQRAPPPTPPPTPMVTPTPAPPPIEKPQLLGLSEEQKRRLEDAFKRVFEEAGIAKIPMATFRDELARLEEDLKTVERERAFDLAYRQIVDVARSLIPTRPLPTPAPTLLPTPPARRPEEVVVPPAEMLGPRRRDVMTLQCWISDCFEQCLVDKDLMRRVSMVPVMKAWSPRGVRYEPLLALPPTFFYSCEKHRYEKFGYRSVYDALAYLLFESRSSTRRMTITKGTFVDVGLDADDIAAIQVEEAKWMARAP